MEVITWLGVYYVKSELYENAIQFFLRASEVEPEDVKWQLMVASCYRRMGSYPQVSPPPLRLSPALTIWWLD